MDFSPVSGEQLVTGLTLGPAWCLPNWPLEDWGLAARPEFEMQVLILGA